MLISDDDIRYIESFLLPEDGHFNAERVAYIKSLDTRDVLACPGSGKTTALLAKLCILSNKLPFHDGRGICVLTHTNVAIDEIKNRLGYSVEKLFRYPNFFGTIQSFVNHFLAIPAYREIFQKNIIYIDFDNYIDAIEARYNSSAFTWLEARGGVETLANYWFEPSKFEIIESYDKRDNPLNKTTNTYQKILNLRRTVLGEGFVSFNDAYVLAESRLLTHPKLKDCFQNRFAICIIDEAQDTNNFQFDLLNKIFPKAESKTTMQCLGDNNQAIYSGLVKCDNFWMPHGTPPFHFSDSMRFGEIIAKVLKFARIDNQISLIHNPLITSAPPYILTFTDDDIKDVMRAFARLIQTHRSMWKHISSPIFKAIGWVGKDKTSEAKKENTFCIAKYHPTFQRKSVQNTTLLPSLLSYIESLNTVGGDIKQKKIILIEAVIHILNLANFKNPVTGRYFTKTSFVTYYKKKYPNGYIAFSSQAAKWLIKLNTQRIEPLTLTDIIIRMIKKYFPQEIMMPKVISFMNSNISQIKIAPIDPAPNIFNTEYGDKIAISTVHGVKGETHTATLYLESSNYGMESKRILPILAGEPMKDSPRIKENVKIFHVGISRATHLVVFACHIDNIAGYQDELQNNGWNIVSTKSQLT